MYKRNKFLKNKLLIILASLTLIACGKTSEEVEEAGGDQKAPQVVTLEKEESDANKLSLDEISSFLYGKLEAQKLVRNYGEDTGWTNLEFGPDGTIKGSYMGKTSVDGFDGGRNWKAEAYYLGEEIHSADFKGNFAITDQVNDYVYKLKLENYEITSEYGLHDDIYFNVDFALGMNSDAEYFLYLPGTPKANLPNSDTKLDGNYKKDDYEEKKTQGFIIWNKTDDEVFNQLKNEYEGPDGQNKNPGA